MAKKKTVLSKSQKGKEAVKKGKKFEDKVADLYRLLGAEVIQNIMVCQKKVDVFATFRIPGSSIGHRIIVECKDEIKAKKQNQRLMQLNGLLNTARKAHEADSAAIITRVPWGDIAKGYAKKEGIELLTYQEKVSQLIDFSPYLQDLVKKFDIKDPAKQKDPPLGSYFVDMPAVQKLNGDIQTIPKLSEYLKDQIINNNEIKHWAILGEYGTGKTSLAQKIARDFAHAYIENPGFVRVPILFSLREFTKALKIDSLVTSFLDAECSVINPRYKLFQAMNEAGVFLLIFDGFDEMALRVEADTLEMNLLEIDKLTAIQNSKTIITSRIEYFITGEEEQKCLSPKDSLLPTRDTEYKTIRITAWEDQQINDFLQKRVPLIKGVKQNWEFYRDEMKKIDGLSDLSHRPVLLDMIVKTLPALIASGKPINRPNLYETYLDGELKRQKIVKRRELLLSQPVRLNVLENIAIDFYDGVFDSIKFKDSRSYVRKIVKPPPAEIEAYTRDFVTCSFLMRKGDEYQFSHRSIMEYLVAKTLNTEINSDKLVRFAKRRLDPVVASFIAEFNPKKELLWKWIYSTKGKNLDIGFLGGNSATLLCLLDKSELVGKDLSRTAILGANLEDINLIGTNFTDTILHRSNLINARFLKNELSKANIHGITVSLILLFKLKEKQNGRKTINIIEKSIEMLFMQPILRLGGYIFEHLDPEYCIAKLMMNARGQEGLELLTKENILSKTTAIKMAFYSNEYEELIQSIPEALRDFANEVISRKFSRRWVMF